MNLPRPKLGSPTGTAPPYVSIACRIGTHGKCTESQPKSAQSRSVTYETCSCPCGHTSSKGASQ